MAVSLSDNRASDRYEVTVDGEIAGVARYVLVSGRIEHVHTEVAGRFAGQGLGATLVVHALRDARSRGLEVVPSCSFVASVIAKNAEEFLDLVPSSRRAEFGLG